MRKQKIKKRATSKPLQMALVACLVAVLGYLVFRSFASGLMTYKPINWTKPGYDYAPSILFDSAANQWVMYNCGLYSDPNYSSDAIWRSTSTDKVNWTSPQPVLFVGNPGTWDDAHVCDPSVLKNVSINGYSWAMWYTGIQGRSGFTSDNKIGLALSNDGIHWSKLARPVIDCGGTSAVYGCGQQSVIKDGSTYRMSHTEFMCQSVDCRLNRLATSTNGISWQSGKTYVMPQEQLSPDFMLGLDGAYYSVIDGNTACGNHPGEGASEVVVYRSPTMWADKSVVTKMGCLSYEDTQGAGRYVAEQGFFRDESGKQLSQMYPNQWVAFGLAQNGYHDNSEEIRAASVYMQEPVPGPVNNVGEGSNPTGSGGQPTTGTSGITDPILKRLFHIRY